MPAAAELPPGGVAWAEDLELEASDGVRLRGAIWRPAEGAGARGLVLFLNGRTEFLEKCAVPAAELTRRGFAVASIDWRGQGLSDRLTRNRLKGHVGTFSDYDRDLQALLAAPQVVSVPGPRVMVAHSMGCAIGLGAIARGILAPDAAILSAPMLGINLGITGWLASQTILPVARALGLTDHWPLFAPEEPYVFSPFEGNVLTQDRAQFDWMAAALRAQPDLQLAAPTMGWIGAALDECDFLARQGPLPCPALCLLGGDETVVDADTVRTAAPRLGAELVEIPGGRHELFIEEAALRRRAWEATDRWLGRIGF